jgi:hypothetical protein
MPGLVRVAHCASNDAGRGGSIPSELSIAPDYPPCVGGGTSLRGSEITGPFDTGFASSMRRFASQWEGGLNAADITPDDLENTITNVTSGLVHVLRVGPSSALVVACAVVPVAAGGLVPCMALGASKKVLRVGGDIIEGFAPSISDLLVGVNASAQRVAVFRDLIDSIADPALDGAVRSFLPEWSAPARPLCAACCNPIAGGINLGYLIQNIAIDFLAVLGTGSGASLVVLTGYATVHAMNGMVTPLSPGPGAVEWLPFQQFVLVAI